jgi:hypothetical protein
MIPIDLFPFGDIAFDPNRVLGSAAAEVTGALDRGSSSPRRRMWFALARLRSPIDRGVRAVMLMLRTESLASSRSSRRPGRTNSIGERERRRRRSGTARMEAEPSLVMTVHHADSTSASILT